jgi:PAP2 superfamily
MYNGDLVGMYAGVRLGPGIRTAHRMEARPLVNLELSWQAAGISAACLAVAAAAGSRSRRPRRMAAAGFAREAAVLFALFGLWMRVGGVGRMSPDGALDRGQWIWHAERVLHMPSETVLQRAFLPHPLIVQALNLYYAGLHFAVVIACLIWVYVWHRRRYRRVRTTLVLFTAGALLIQFVPVAPPRMLPHDGMVDTAVRYGQSVYGSVAGFNADQLSAMPSVHVGWSLLAALVIVEVSRSRWRWLALAYPLLTLLAVVVTANHYWMDGIAAALLLALALIVQRAGRTATAAWRTRSGAVPARRPVPVSTPSADLPPVLVGDPLLPDRQQTPHVRSPR